MILAAKLAKNAGMLAKLETAAPDFLPAHHAKRREKL
jgi:hypothetical protein